VATGTAPEACTTFTSSAAVATVATIGAFAVASGSTASYCVIAVYDTAGDERITLIIDACAKGITSNTIAAGTISSFSGINPGASVSAIAGINCPTGPSAYASSTAVTTFIAGTRVSDAVSG
jgi:hypothetical protein